MTDVQMEIAQVMERGRLLVLYGIPLIAAVGYVVMVARAIKDQR